MEIELEAVEEPRQDGFDEEVVEDIDCHRRNKRDKVAHITGLRAADADDPPSTVEVEFELLHGDETFVEAFETDTSLYSSTIDGLLNHADLDPETDSVADLAGREVSIERTGDEWTVQLDGDQEEVTQTPTTGVQITMLSVGLLLVVTMFALPFALLAGTAGVVMGSPFAFLLVFPVLTAFSTLAYYGAGKIMDAQDFSGLPSAYHNMEDAFEGEMSSGKFVFHLATGGFFL